MQMHQTLFILLGRPSVVRKIHIICLPDTQYVPLLSYIQQYQRHQDQR